MSKTIQITYFGMEGEGKTLTEAKQDAGRKLEAAMDGSYLPYVFTHMGHTLIVFREPDGWAYMMIYPDDDGQKSGSSSGGNSQEETIRQGLRHMAQNLYNPKTGEDGMSVLRNKDDIRQHQNWVEWQRVYLAWADLGASDGTCRDYANRREWPAVGTVITVEKH